MPHVTFIHGIGLMNGQPQAAGIAPPPAPPVQVEP
jgi:hypothetical protein